MWCAVVANERTIMPPQRVAEGVRGATIEIPSDPSQDGTRGAKSDDEAALGRIDAIQREAEREARECARGHQHPATPRVEAVERPRVRLDGVGRCDQRRKARHARERGPPDHEVTTTNEAVPLEAERAFGIRAYAGRRLRSQERGVEERNAREE